MTTKRFFFAVLLLFVTLSGYAQQFGASAQALLYFQTPREYNITQTWQNNRVMRTGSTPAAGIRIEVNYILPGYTVPVSAYNGIGLTYIAPSTDSAVYHARLVNGGFMEIVGTQRTSMLNIGLRCGYEIPQEFNEFLLIHVGWGIQFSSVTVTNILPEQSTTFNYEKSDFESEDLELPKYRGAALELLAGGIYEFEKFSVIGQYSVIVRVMSDRPGLRHGLSVGVFVPFYSF